MTPTIDFPALTAEIRRFIRQASASIPAAEAPRLDDRFTTLALALFALQHEAVPALRRLNEARGIDPSGISRWRDLPALPAAAFKEWELTSLPPDERATVFHSSGTTGQKPSRHFHDALSLELYEASVITWFGPHLFPERVAGGRMKMLALTPPPSAAPHSSLVHMFDTVRRAFGAEGSEFVGHADQGQWFIDHERSQAALDAAEACDRPTLLLGTAFSFVHLLDELASVGRRARLPPGSRVMETGGYKGRSRQMTRPELHALITDWLGVPPTHLLCEYGMSELGSQAYDGVVDRLSPVAAPSPTLTPRAFRFPPWARAMVISPETGLEVAEGETGLLRVVDLANVRSIMAVQSEDLAIRRGDGFELLGRGPGAEPRGCSLMPA
ncbi:MAG: long-chain-fatty-acid--protein ligase [Limisphaerales bacterium]